MFWGDSTYRSLQKRPVFSSISLLSGASLSDLWKASHITRIERYAQLVG